MANLAPRYFKVGLKEWPFKKKDDTMMMMMENENDLSAEPALSSVHRWCHPSQTIFLLPVSPLQAFVFVPLLYMHHPL